MKCLIKLLIFQSEECLDPSEQSLVDYLSSLLEFLMSLLELIRSNQGHNQVHLHQSPLLSCQVGVCLQLLRDSLCELVPVEVAEDLLEVVSVDACSVSGFFLREGAHVQLHEVIVLESLGKVEASTAL